jgi:hypothetical protein
MSNEDIGRSYAEIRRSKKLLKLNIKYDLGSSFESVRKTIRYTLSMTEDRKLALVIPDDNYATCDTTLTSYF